MAEEAERGLAWRKEFKRGGTRVGVTRANQIARKDGLSLETVKRMKSFFARHERATKGGQGFKRGQKGYPSAGRIAWALWGGDAGQSWAERIVEKENKKMSEENQKRFTFQVNVGNVDRESGVLRDVVIIEAGEARGHRMMVSERTLDAAVGLLADDILPAYITHNGAFQDRLLNEIGAFEGFYRDGDKIRAERFETLQSWRKAEPDKYERLFDLAEKMPKTFGISIVFEGTLAWETDGGEVPFASLNEKPEDSLFDLPTITPSKIQSADFVDTPAATSALFAENWDKPANVEEAFIMPEDIEKPIEVAASESASSELERRQAEESAASEEPKAEAAEEKPKRKKKLEEAETLETEQVELEEIEEEQTEAIEEVELSEHAAQLNERDSMISEQQCRIAELENQVATLKAVFGGEEEIADDLAAEVEPEKTTDQLKAESIEEHLRANPRDSRMTAVLAVYKTKPELFSAN
jgi:hypothetical protein